MIELLLAAAMLTQAAPAEEKNRIVGVASNEQATVLMRNEQGICPKGWRMAVLILPKVSQYFHGCWTVGDNRVIYKWEDGDGGAAAIPTINWAPGKQPKSL
jgi:hypothetical protein